MDDYRPLRKDGEEADSREHMEHADPSSHRRSSPQKTTTTYLAIALMTYVNVFNYVDRMIISGAPNEFQTFVRDTTNVEVTKESVYLGYLMSAFIAGFCVANLAFGHLAKFRPPFELVASGLTVWIVAVFLSGVAKPAQSFWMLICARALSGVGEAALQTVVPAFIDSNVEPHRKSVALAVFYLGFPVGGAVGFLWGSTMATSLGWNWAFWLEIPAVAPVIVISALGLRRAYGPPEGKLKVNSRYKHRLSCRSDIAPIVSSREYMLVTVGSAAMIALISSFATYAPSFMQGLGFFEKESDAAFTFGVMTCACGLIGTLLGGIINDALKTRWRRGKTYREQDENLVNAKLCTAQMIVASAIAVGCFSYGVYADKKSVFLCALFLGELALFLPTAVQIEVLLLFVERTRRGLAMGLYNFLGHVMGDIPSPIIVGALKDHWAPKCNSIKACCSSDDCAPSLCCVDITHWSNETCPSEHSSLRSVLNMSCPENVSGLRLTLLVAVFWLLASIGSWGLLYAKLRCAKDSVRFMDSDDSEGSPRRRRRKRKMRTCGETTTRLIVDSEDEDVEYAPPATGLIKPE